jgi:hypothetical protein
MLMKSQARAESNLNRERTMRLGNATEGYGKRRRRQCDAQTLKMT